MIVSAKSTSNASKVVPFPPDPNSPHSTISTVQREISEAGGDATAIACDTRDYENVKRMVNEAVNLHNGRLDVVIYNSGAIWWSAVETTPMKRFQLMQRVNPEGRRRTVLQSAASDCHRPLRHDTSSAAVVQDERLERSDNRRQPTNIQPLF